jgi:hypothetical protein
MKETFKIEEEQVRTKKITNYKKVPRMVFENLDASPILNKNINKLQEFTELSKHGRQ